MVVLACVPESISKSQNENEAEIWESEGDESDRIDDVMDDTIPMKFVQLIRMFILS